MKIRKAVLLTFLYLVLEVVIQLISYFIFDTENFFEHDHIKGGTIIIARVIAYLILFYFFWNPKSDIFSFKYEKFGISVIPALFLILLGTEFLNRPFLDFSRLLDYTPVDFVYEGYSTIQIYSALTSLLVAPVFEELFLENSYFKNCC